VDILGKTVTTNSDRKIIHATCNFQSNYGNLSKGEIKKIYH